jgi:hypothetical protein
LTGGEDVTLDMLIGTILLCPDCDGVETKAL